ncbi:hypothetical protein [Thioalkalivibrio sp. ALMg11]|uniref:hypothetical protein n=1 Tax=Thioalkalivibrio sp. ALMg11 TaxID=1158165 RepID=UPI00036B7DBA|nr:hypothetical protein [Thioalkalivibrio sp. ALMg11]
MKRRIHKIEYSIPSATAPGEREHKTAYVDAYSAPRARTTLFNELFRIESQSTAKADELSEAIRSMSQGLPGISVFYEPEDASAEAQEESAEGEGSEREGAEEPNRSSASATPAAETRTPESAPVAATEQPSSHESGPAAVTPPAAPALAPASGAVPF